MADPPRQPTIPPEPAWARLCRWLWNQRGFLGGTVILGFALNLIAGWLLTPLGITFSQTRLGSLLGHPLPFALGGVGLLGLTTGLWLINRLHPAPASQETSPRLQAVLLTREYRRRLLARLHSLYQDYVKQSLWGMPRMELRLERTFGVTDHPALSGSYRPAGAREAITPGTPILDVYHEAGDGLLILGKSGAGKSTLLYDLALALTERAGHDATQLPPVLLSLTSWAEKRLPLEQWLAEELQTKYQVQRTLAPGWLLADQLLPLLDGLDEMAEEARSACIEAINTYRRGHPLPIVISSRSAEYLSQERKLHLQSAIEVQLLTPKQVDDSLKGEGKPLEAVRAALGTDAVLRDLVTTPLMLSVVMQVYRGKTVIDLPRFDTEEEQQHQVFEHYVTRMLEPTAKPTRKWHYPSDSTQKWLIWLALQLQKRSLTEFYLERLQGSWLPTKQDQQRYPWLSGLVLGLVVGLIVGLVFWLGFGPLFRPVFEPLYRPGGLVFREFVRLGGWPLVGPLYGMSYGIVGWLLYGPSGLVFGLVFGLLGGLFGGGSILQASTDIKPTERLSPSLSQLWRRQPQALVFGLVLGLVVGLVVGLVSGLLGLGGGLVSGLVSGLLGGLFTLGAVWLEVLLVALFSEQSEAQFDEHVSLNPNQGIYNSGWNALLIGAIGGLGGGLLVGLFFGLPVGLLVGLFFGLLVGLLVGLFGGLMFGGAVYLSHYTLRFLLWRSGAMPWFYVRFLEEAHERILLQPTIGGGGYRFIHPLLQEYFASPGTGTAANTQSEPSSPPQP